ncbi:MAG: hypothetical protein AB7I19_03205 [Planctomycetota bacterium]
MSAGRNDQKGRGCAGVFLMVWGLAFGGGGAAAYFSESGHDAWWFAGIFVLIGAAAFFGGLTLLIRKPRSKVALASPLQAGGVTSVRRELAPDGQYILRPAAFRGCKVVFVGVLATGFTIATFYMFSARGSGGPPTFMAVIFGFFSLLLILATIHQSLAMTNPVPVLYVRSEELAIGMRHRLGFEFTGSTSRLSSIRVEFVGREEASYRRGTDTVTDKNEFLVRTLFERDLMVEGLAAGTQRSEFELELDRNVVPTFKSRSNKVVWFLRVVAPIRWWPDVRDEIEIPIGGYVAASEHGHSEVRS